jgi:Uma2 family endonuclease
MAIQNCVSVAEFARSLDGRAGRRELVDGAVMNETHPGSLLPARIAAIAAPIFDYLAERRAGRCLAPAPGFALAFQPAIVRVPDVAFIRNERMERLRKLGCVLVGYPDLAILVVTAPERLTAAQERAADLRRAGTRLAWLIDPWRNQITTYSADTRVLCPDDVLCGEPVLPAFRCRVAEVLS